MSLFALIRGSYTLDSSWEPLESKDLCMLAELFLFFVWNFPRFFSNCRVAQPETSGFFFVDDKKFCCPVVNSGDLLKVLWLSFFGLGIPLYIDCV